MKNPVFWDITPCGSWHNRHFGEHIASIFRVKDSLSSLGLQCGCSSEQTGKRASCNGISTVVTMEKQLSGRCYFAVCFSCS
jgi:hypothetical protein